MQPRTKSEVDRLIDEGGIRDAAGQCGVASVLFTYRCTIRCRHCLFGCRGDLPDVAMTPRQCADGLALLHETGRVIHIAGGEAMLYWETLSESIRLAHEEENAPHFIETNCSFAMDDAVVRERLEFMRAHGVKGLFASADAYHQEFVPAERFLRVRRTAREIFGAENFYGPEEEDVEIERLEEITDDESVLRDHVRDHPPNMVGTASTRLAPYLDAFGPRDPQLPARGWRGKPQLSSCREQFETTAMWELHLDPYGNLQTNCGIILGNAADITPAQLLADGPEHANRFVRRLCEGGAVGLAELAHSEYGFAFPARVSQSCELCYLTRRHLHRFRPEVFGPAEIYS